MGFNPTFDKTNPLRDSSAEAISNVFVIDAKCKTDNTVFVRADRSMESLLSPLQYKAPTFMNSPELGGHFSRFPSPPSRFSIPFLTTSDLAVYSPIYAAAGFCQNLALKSYPEAHPVKVYPQGIDKPEAAFPLMAEKVWRETIDNKAVSNCWHAFEERVQYPRGMKQAIYQTRYQQQVKRCENDYKNLHLINADQWSDCQNNGRSTIKARADMAYRLDNTEYLAYLNTLGITTRQILYAQALADQETFEQTLLLERKAVTRSMKIPERPYIGEPMGKQDELVITPM
jgi:hypothetical protein